MNTKELLDKIQIVSFNYENDSRKSFGVVAQQLEKLFPKEQFSIVSSDNNGYLRVDYAQLASLLWAIVQTQQEQIDQLKREVINENEKKPC